METDAPGALFSMDARHCKTAETKLSLAHRRHSRKCAEGTFPEMEGVGEMEGNAGVSAVGRSDSGGAQSLQRVQKKMGEGARGPGPSSQP